MSEMLRNNPHEMLCQSIQISPVHQKGNKMLDKQRRPDHTAVY